MSKLNSTKRDQFNQEKFIAIITWEK